MRKMRKTEDFVKSKKLNVKLVLNKKTIADVGANDMSQVNGGIALEGTYYPGCNIFTCVKWTCHCTDGFSCPDTAC